MLRLDVFYFFVPKKQHKLILMVLFWKYDSGVRRLYTYKQWPTLKDWWIIRLQEKMCIFINVFDVMFYISHAVLTKTLFIFVKNVTYCLIKDSNFKDLIPQGYVSWTFYFSEVHIHARSSLCTCKNGANSEMIYNLYYLW